VILTLVFLERFQGYSRGVLVLDGVLFFLLASGLRLVYKGLQRGFGWRAATGPAVLILGADDEGERCLRDLRAADEPRRRVRGFLDADPRKVGRTIHDVPILGTDRDLERIAGSRGIREVVVADLASADEEFRGRCRALGIAIRFHGLASGDGTRGDAGSG
jgi:FlaA1/EpsC-like NDP-sugar epimerase